MKFFYRNQRQLFYGERFLGKADKSISQRTGSRKYTSRVISRMENKFIAIPRETISGIFKYPEPKTTAFGGVATGSM